MALSGTIYTNVDSHWRLQLEWSATQNVTANTSRITSKLYWIALDSYGTINSTASKTSAIQIDDGSWSTETVTAGLKANQKKLVNTYEKTISHNADGTGSFSIDAYFDINVTLSKYYGRIDLDQKSFTLNTIPRASTLSSSANFKAGEDFTVSLKRNSTDFSHEVEIYIGTKLLKTLTFSTSETSKSTAFTDAQKNLALTEMIGSTSKTSRIVVTTKKGSTVIGEKTYSGTVSTPATSYGVTPSGFNIGDSFTVTIKSPNEDFTHTVRLKDGTTSLKSYTGVKGSVLVTTSDIKTALYNATPDSLTKDFVVEVVTYLGTDILGTARTTTIEGRVTNSDPVFTSAGVTYADNNPITTAITGDSSILIENKSNLQVTIPLAYRATGVNGAWIKEYEVTANGITKTATFSSLNVVVNMELVTAGSNSPITISAIDSRGNSVTVSKTMVVMPYTAPLIAPKALRVNGIEPTTQLTVTGSFNLMPINGSNRNSLIALSGQQSALQYRYRENIKTTSFPSVWTNLAYATSGNTFTSLPENIQLDSTKGYVFEFRITDKLGTTVATRTVNSGRPVVAFDKNLGSVGIGKFPSHPNSIDVLGDVDSDGMYTNLLEVYSLATLKGIGEMLRFDMSTHAYMAWFEDGIRQAYFGFPSASAKHINIHNQKLDKTLAISDRLLWNSKEVLSGENVATGAGSSSMTANSPKSIAVSFGKTMPSIPVVVATLETTVPGYYSSGTWVSGIAVDKITTTGFTMYITRTNTTNTSFQWIAVCL